MNKTTQTTDVDLLKIYVKKSKSEIIINNYKTFGWQLKAQEENSRYEDIYDLIFERPHKIKNKDELQLMQVYMEDKLNALGRLEKNKYPKTTAFGLFFGVIGILLSIFSILFAFKIFPDINITMGIIMSCIGVVFVILTIVFIPKLRKKEFSYFKNQSLTFQNEISEICKKASLLIRGDLNE